MTGSKPDLVVLSPGPGTPEDFDCKATIKKARKRGLADLRRLPRFAGAWPRPMVERSASCMCRCTANPRASGLPSKGKIFSGLPKEVTVGRYHSIFADPVRLPDEFVVTAETEDGVIMAFEHKSEPIAAVQFHPELIMTLGHNAGMRMIENVVAHLPRRAKERAA